MSADGPRILIAGAGIGGLSLALALRRRGHGAVTVVEQATLLREVGAGVQLTPNAVRCLLRLGLGERLRAIGVVPSAVQSRHWKSGRLIRDFPLGDCEARYGVPYYQVHRAQLHGALAEALGPAPLRLGARCTGFAAEGDRVTLALASGEHLEGDVLVAADGIHSVIRAGLFGAEAPEFSGTVCWRGLTPADSIARFNLPRTATSWWGPNRHFVTYFVAGGALMNWVGVIRGASWRKESWSETGDPDEVAREFAGWHPIVEAIIRGSGQPFRWALYDREPLATWTRGRVTLLGDAAHPMLPFMSQGAAQSIEDGYVLARCLTERREDPARALLDYEAIRIDRTREIQLGSRANGRMYHLSSPLARLIRDVSFRLASRSERNAKRQQQDRIFRYDCDVEVERHLAAG